MLIATKGIVFKTVKFQETSLIVKMLTSTHGVQTFMVKGVRSVKANGKAAMFQSGMMLDMIMYYQENKSFKTLKEYKAAHVYETALYDIKKSSVLIFLIEMLEQCVQEENEEEQLFEFISQSLINFDQNAFNPDFHIHFLMELMKHQGIFPQGTYSDTLNIFDVKEGEFISETTHQPFVLNQADSYLFGQLIANENIELNRTQRKKALDLILKYYTYHSESYRGVKSLSVLEMVLG